MSDQFLLVCCSCVCRIYPSQVQRPHSLSRTLNGAQGSKLPIEKVPLKLQTEDHLNNIYSSYLRTFYFECCLINPNSKSESNLQLLPVYSSTSRSSKFILTLDFRCRYWNRQFQRLCRSIIESVQKCRAIIIINVYCQTVVHETPRYLFELKQL